MASGLGTFEKVLRAGEGRRLKRIAEQAEYVLSLQPEFEKLLYLALMGNWERDLDSVAAEALMP